MDGYGEPKPDDDAEGRGAVAGSGGTARNGPGDVVDTDGTAGDGKGTTEDGGDDVCAGPGEDNPKGAGAFAGAGADDGELGDDRPLNTPSRKRSIAPGTAPHQHR